MRRSFGQDVPTLNRKIGYQPTPWRRSRDWEGPGKKKAKQVLMVSKTRAVKSKVQLRYTEAHKEVKRNIRTDKRNYVEQLQLK